MYDAYVAVHDATRRQQCCWCCRLYHGLPASRVELQSYIVEELYACGVNPVSSKTFLCVHVSIHLVAYIIHCCTYRTALSSEEKSAVPHPSIPQHTRHYFYPTCRFTQTTLAQKKQTMKSVPPARTDSAHSRFDYLFSLMYTKRGVSRQSV